MYRLVVPLASAAVAASTLSIAGKASPCQNEQETHDALGHKARQSPPPPASPAPPQARHWEVDEAWKQAVLLQAARTGDINAIEDILRGRIPRDSSYAQMAAAVGMGDIERVEELLHTNQDDGHSETLFEAASNSDASATTAIADRSQDPAFEDDCKEVIRIARLMNSSGLNEGTSGNVSLRIPGGFLITPSGRPYETLSPTDIVFVDDDGGYFGELLPSSEWRLHFDIYQSKPNAHAVVHAHPDYCTALAALREPIPAFHYMVGVAGGKEIRCAKYETFGSQALSDAVLEALGNETRACLLANHGMICYGTSLGKTLGLAQSIEMLARQYIISKSISLPTILSDAEMEVILAKFKTYGKQPDELQSMGHFCREHAVEPPPRRD